MRRPFPWPAGAAAEPSRRAIVRTVAMMYSIEAAFAIVFTVAGDSGFLVIYAGISLVLGLLWTVKYRRVVRIEAALGVELYRSVGSLRSWQMRPTYFARVPDQLARVPDQR